MTLAALAAKTKLTEQAVTEKVLGKYRNDPSDAIDYIALHAPHHVSD